MKSLYVIVYVFICIVAHKRILAKDFMIVSSTCISSIQPCSMWIVLCSARVVELLYIVIPCSSEVRKNITDKDLRICMYNL